jgi:hypothetical protein
VKNDKCVYLVANKVVKEIFSVSPPWKFATHPDNRDRRFERHGDDAQRCDSVDVTCSRNRT